METERNQQRNQDGRTDRVRDGDSAAKRMEEGRLYFPGDEDILKEQMEGMELLYDYNATRPRESARRTSLLEQMFGSIGRDCYIEPPLHSNWGGRHVYMGDFVYANFNLTLVDDGEIYIGSHCMIGPNVTIATASHLCHSFRSRHQDHPSVLFEWTLRSHKTALTDAAQYG